MYYDPFISVRGFLKVKKYKNHEKKINLIPLKKAECGLL